MAGLDLGVDKYEGSFGGIGGCPFAPKATGNICTEDLVYLLEEMSIGTGIDLRKLSGIACDVEATVGHALPGQIMKAGLRSISTRWTPCAWPKADGARRDGSRYDEERSEGEDAGEAVTLASGDTDSLIRAAIDEMSSDETHNPRHVHA